MKQIGYFLVGVLLVVVVGMSCFAALSSTLDMEKFEEKDYKIVQGDTLWALAEKHCPPDVDCREWIQAVIDLNGMQNSSIMAGQEIIILVGVCDD